MTLEAVPDPPDEEKERVNKRNDRVMSTLAMVCLGTVAVCCTGYICAWIIERAIRLFQ